MLDPKPLVELCEQGVREGVFPGAAFAFGTARKSAFGFAGRHRYETDSPKVSARTFFDLASVSKVLGTTTAAMVLCDDGSLDLDAPVHAYVREFQGLGKDKVAVRNLLLHDSGLPAYASYQKDAPSPEETVHRLLAEELRKPCGADTVYSCVNAITLQKVVESVAGLPLDRLLRARVFDPLGMGSTHFNPGASLKSYCAPTERIESWRRNVRVKRGSAYAADEQWIQGEVHDPLAFLLGGVSGNAGLFAPAGDVARFLQEVLRCLAGRKSAVFTTATLAAWTKRASNASSRALGWDTKSPEGSSAGKVFSEASFGHTGYTGTSVWVDPKRGLFAALLTNRVHPSAANEKIAEFRPRFHDLAAELFDRQPAV